MIPYFISFILSPLLFELAASEKNYKIRKLLIVSSIMILCLLAALRDINVGTDVLVYQLSFFNKACRSASFINFCKEISIYSKDYLYLLITYICAKLFGDIHCFFFVIELVAIIPIFYILWNYRKKFRPGIALLAYCLLLYAETFNVVRQMVAVSFSFLGLYFLSKNEKKGYIILFISIFFHSTSIISFLIPLMFLISKIKKKWLRNVIIVFIVIMFFIASLSYGKMIEVLVGVGLLPIKYINEAYLSQNTFDFPIIRIAICMLAVLLMLILKMIRKKDYKESQISNDTVSYDYLFFTSLIALSIVVLSTYNPILVRMAWYFEIYNMLVFALGYRLLKNTSINRTIYIFMVYIILFSAWMYNYAVIGNAGLYPYKFMF